MWSSRYDNCCIGGSAVLLLRAGRQMLCCVEWLLPATVGGCCSYHRPILHKNYGTAAAVEVVEKESGSAVREKIRCYAFVACVTHQS